MIDGQSFTFWENHATIHHPKKLSFLELCFYLSNFNVKWKKKNIIHSCTPIVLSYLFQNYHLWQVHQSLLYLFFYLSYINSLTHLICHVSTFFLSFSLSFTIVSIVTYYIFYCYFSIFSLTLFLYAHVFSHKTSLILFFFSL